MSSQSNFIVSTILDKTRRISTRKFDKLLLIFNYFKILELFFKNILTNRRKYCIIIKQYIVWAISSVGRALDF